MIAKFNTSGNTSTGDSKGINPLFIILGLALLGYVGYRYISNKKQEEEKQIKND